MVRVTEYRMITFSEAHYTFTTTLEALSKSFQPNYDVIVSPFVACHNRWCLTAISDVSSSLTRYRTPSAAPRLIVSAASSRRTHLRIRPSWPGSILTAMLPDVQLYSRLNLTPTRDRLPSLREEGYAYYSLSNLNYITAQLRQCLSCFLS